MKQTKRAASLLLVIALLATLAVFPIRATGENTVNSFTAYALGGLVGGTTYDSNITLNNYGGTDRVLVSGRGGTNYGDTNNPRSTMGVYSESAYALDGLEILYSVESWVQSGDHWYAIALTAEKGEWFENDGSDRALFFMFAYNNGYVTLAAHHIGNGAGWTYIGTSQGVPATGGQYSIRLHKANSGYEVYMKNASQSDYTLQNFGGTTVLAQSIVSGLFSDETAYLTAGAYVATYEGTWSFVLGAHAPQEEPPVVEPQSANGFTAFATGGLVGGTTYDPNIEVDDCNTTDRVQVTGRGGTNYGDTTKPRSTMGVYSAAKYDIDGIEILYSVEQWVSSGNHWYAIALTENNGEWFENDGSDDALFFQFAYNNGYVTLAAHYVGNGSGWTYLGTSQGVPATGGQYGIFLQKVSGGYNVYMKNAVQSEYTRQDFNGNPLLSGTIVDGLFPDGEAYLMAGGYVESYAGEWSFILGAKQKQIPAPEICSAKLILDENINVVYSVANAEFYINPCMVFTMNGHTSTVTDYTVDADGRYQFVFSGVTPQCMGDNISATFHGGMGGQDYTDTIASYSIRQYCVNLLGSSSNNVTLQTVLSDLLTYGAAAQQYAHYRTDALVTAGLNLTPSVFTGMTADAASFSGKIATGLDWVSASLILSSNPGIRFTFAADTVVNLSVRVSVNGKEQTFTTFSSANGLYYVDYYGVSATEFGDSVSASFYRSGRKVGKTLLYSFNSYIYQMKDSEDTALKALVRALYLYGESAKTYSAWYEEQLLLDNRNYDCISNYQPRVNFGAKFEPKGNYILHGAGQDRYGLITDFTNYTNIMSSTSRPTLVSGYAAPHHDFVTWGGNMRQQISAYGDNQFLFLQIGVHFNEDENPDKCYYDKIASGEMDDTMISLINVLKAFNHPVFCRPGFEFNGAWNGYSDPAIYRAAFIHFAELVAYCEADNIALVWCFSPDAADLDYMKYYPGDDYVDWWAIDIFGSTQTTMAATESFLADAAFHEKPVMIAEATPCGYDVTQGQGWNEWFVPYFNFIRNHPVIKATCYINWDWEAIGGWSGWGRSCLERAPTEFVLNYRAELQDPIYFHVKNKQAAIEAIYDCRDYS
ncbi:MAG: hypothetical protein IJJ99_02745 [Oscillospiraceae bacterium]|nr:hypothetical protein [Oscillospiraceae bacterium]